MYCLDSNLNTNQLSGTFPSEITALGNLNALYDRQHLSLLLLRCSPSFTNTLPDCVVRPIVTWATINLQEAFLFFLEHSPVWLICTNTISSLYQLVESTSELWCCNHFKAYSLPFFRWNVVLLLLAHDSVLSGNQFSGTIPSNLNSLTQLQSLYVTALWKSCSIGEYFLSSQLSDSLTFDNVRQCVWPKGTWTATK